MQRVINNPDNVVEEMLKGYVKNHRDLATATSNPRVIKYINAPVPGKVGIVTGGGSGHKPAFVGYVGRNMVDACAVGEVFSSPTAKAFSDALSAADSGRGVACLYGNFAGDNMNVKLAQKMAQKNGVEVQTVVANDDVASAPKDEAEKRRGGAGEIFMWKTAGAKAARGADLGEVIAVAKKSIANTRSVGVGLTPCTIPAVGKPNFEIADGTMEMGIGHHGEPGVSVSALKSADEIAEMMLGIILPDLPFEGGCEVAAMVSGLGATPVMECYILFNRVYDILEENGIKIYRSYVGNYFTSLEMMGVTITLTRLDDELKSLVDAEADSMGLKQFYYK
jgi:dihydroxyacetone kinase-like protein